MNLDPKATWPRLRGLNALMLSGRHSPAVKHAVGEEKTQQQQDTFLRHICYLLSSHLRVHGQVTLSARGRLHPCKNDFGINSFRANTGVNIL